MYSSMYAEHFYICCLLSLTVDVPQWPRWNTHVDAAISRHHERRGDVDDTTTFQGHSGIPNFKTGDLQYWRQRACKPLQHRHWYLFKPDKTVKYCRVYLIRPFRLILSVDINATHSIVNPKKLLKNFSVSLAGGHKRDTNTLKSQCVETKTHEIAISTHSLWKIMQSCVLRLHLHVF